MKYGKDGVSGTTCYKYMFDGDPSDTVTGWTERNVGNNPGDRRGLGAVGPVTIKAGETYFMPIAYVFAQKQNGNTVTNFELMKQYWSDLKDFYAHKYGAVENVSPLGQGINIFPNPTQSNLTISFGNLQAEKIVLTDNIGRVVKTVDLLGASGAYKMDVSGLPNGMYLIRCDTKTGTSVQKLIISR